MNSIAHADISPAFAERNVPVALATDENYLPYLKVTINSAIASSHGSNLDIIVLHAGIPEDAILDFTAGYAGVGNASVRFVDISEELETSGLSDYKQTARLPLSACYRLLLPRVLAAYGKVVYLDVDVAVCRDLGELYATDVGDNYFAAAKDVVYTTKPEYVSWAAKWGFEEWDGYVNTGVLVMNLERFRREPVFDRLKEIVFEAAKWNCDQDALNFVCKGAIAPLDPRWNVQLGDYCISKQIALTGNDMWIGHFTGAQKPWSHPNHMYAHLWWSYVPCEEGCMLWRKAYGDREPVLIGEDVAVSVIIPVYNAQTYLAQMLLSCCAQTLQNVEIICVNDGSTDGSLEICERFASFDSRIRIFSQKNLGAAVARNRGIEEARGRWLFFGDADDFCRHDMLEELVRAGQNDCHDVVVAGRMIMDCGRSMLVREVGVPRGYFGKGRNVNCHTDGINVFAGIGFAPWNKLFRRAFVIEKGIKFHNNPSCDDVFFVFSSLIAAESIAFVDRSYYYYRANLPTSQMGNADKYPTNFLVALREVHDVVATCDVALQRQYFRAAIRSSFENLFKRVTPEGLRKTYAALCSGGLQALEFSAVDPKSVDMGQYNVAYELALRGADLCEVLHAYYRPRCTALASDNTYLRKERTVLSDKVNELRRANEEKKVRIGALGEQRRQLSEKVDELRAANEAKRQKLGEVEAGRRQLSEKVDELRAANEAKRQKLGELEAGRRQLSEKVDALRAANEAKRQKLGELEAKRLRLSEKVDELRAANEAKKLLLGEISGRFKRQRSVLSAIRDICS